MLRHEIRRPSSTAPRLLADQTSDKRILTRSTMTSKGTVRTVSEARLWFAKLGRDGAADVTIKEPFQEVGGGLVIVTASLRREDGAQVNIAIYCFDDTPPDVVDWLPPILDEGRGNVS